MNKDQLTRTIIIQAALNMLPSSISSELSDDQDFKEKYGLASDSVVSFGDTNISFSGSKFYKA